MSDPFLGEIRAFGFNFTPRNWASCDGQLMPISSNEALFSLLGTIYGGDGRTTFALPDLRGRSMMHKGRGPGLNDKTIGERGGREYITLTANELPAHSHTATIYAESGTADKYNATNKMLATSTSTEIYTKPKPAPDSPLAPQSIVVNNAGGGQAFASSSPYLTVNLCIATQGVFPSRN